MRHNLSIEGYAFRLRPIVDTDAAFVVALRSNPELNRYLHAGANRLKDQLAWLAQYYEREGAYYFVIERCTNGMSEGVIGLYDIDLAARSGEWGWWILRPSSLAGVESAYLIYRTAFELLGLSSVHCCTVSDNDKVVSFHDSCGITARKFLSQHFELGGHRHDAVEHHVDLASWIGIKPGLEQLAQLTARRINRG